MMYFLIGVFLLKKLWMYFYLFIKKYGCVFIYLLKK